MLIRSILLALVIWVLPSLSVAQSLPRSCESTQYDERIEGAIREFWPRSFYKPLAWKAQLCQESLLKEDAKSPVGAMGIAQFMGATAQDMSRIFKTDFDPYNADDSIRFGAYYVHRRSSPWRRRGRTYEQALELGQACYNAGCGNILKAQKISGNKRLWSEISPSLCYVTGPANCHETQTYVERIRRWRIAMGDCLENSR